MPSATLVKFDRRIRTISTVLTFNETENQRDYKLLHKKKHGWKDSYETGVDVANTSR